MKNEKKYYNVISKNTNGFMDVNNRFFFPGYIWPHKYVNVTLYIPIKHMISWINVKIFKELSPISVIYIVSKSFKSTKYVRHSPLRYLEHHFHEKSDWHRTGKVSENASK